MPLIFFPLCIFVTEKIRISRLSPVLNSGELSNLALQAASKDKDKNSTDR